MDEITPQEIIVSPVESRQQNDANTSREKEVKHNVPCRQSLN